MILQMCLSVYISNMVTFPGADLGSPRPPHFEAQIFANAATPLHDVSKILARPPLHKSWIRTCVSIE